MKKQRFSAISYKKVFSALVLLFIGSMFIEVSAQGIIFPRPCPRPIIHCPPPIQIPQVPLKVKSIHVSTKITEQASTTHIVQVFRNDSPYTVEGLYFFPLPDDVSITEFAMWDGDKRLTGEVRKKEDARRIYDDIVRSRKDPALLEYVGRNLFQASVFPILPHSDKKIELTYTQILKLEGGAVSFRYPLGTGWRANQFSWRTSVPRLDPENQIPRSNESMTGAKVSAEIEIYSNAPIKSVYSPSHDIEVKREGEHKARISLEVKATSSQPDLRLLYTLSNKDIGLSLLTYKEPGKDGYFMLIASPKVELKNRDVIPKDIIFVIDTSGSMGESGKMEKAKSALRLGIESLNSDDHFNIISFAGEDHLFNEGLIKADNPSKQQAKDFVDRLKALGGTNINDALLTAFKQVQKNNRPRMIVFITDGQATVGITKTEIIMSNVKQANSSNVRLFSLGVGYDINTSLLDGLSINNRGTPAYIEPNEDLEVKLGDFFTKINNPVLSDVEIDWGSLDTSLVYPRILPDIFSNSQLIVIGRYKSSTDTLTLSGKVNGKEQKFIYDNLKFSDKQSDNDFLPHLWAAKRVGFLIEQIRQNGDSKELRDEIIELGTKYGIVTPYTSHLVQEPVLNGRRFSHLPGIVPSLAANADDYSRHEAAAKQKSGTEAVKLSKQNQDLQVSNRQFNNGGSIDEGKLSDARLQRAQNQTFYILNNIWVDGQYKDEDKAKIVKLKFGTDEYFNLITQEPKLAEIFSLGKQVLVVWKGNIYQTIE